VRQKEKEEKGTWVKQGPGKGGRCSVGGVPAWSGPTGNT